MGKIIETTLPLKELSDSAMKDKVRKGHPGNLHLWWNRSPIDSSAALLWACIKDAPADTIATEEQKKEILDQLIHISSGDDFTVENFDKPYPTVCDPFSGFGGLAIAAQKIGLSVKAGDLNSVASLLTMAATEIPARFWDNGPVNPEADNKLYFGAEGLAKDVEYYGKWVKETAYSKLKTYYPPAEISEPKEKHPVYAWIWVRTMKCPNPACGCQMPLANSFVLSKTKGNEYWIEPEVVDKKLHFKINKGICPEGKETNKHETSGAKFRCPACGEITKDDVVKKAGKNGNLNMQLMATCIQTDAGKIFIEPDNQQMEAAKVEFPKEMPVGSIPNNTRWFSPPEYGETEYADLYTPRQLLLMTTLCDMVPKAIEMATADALHAGMSGEDDSLANGGAGALAYGQAVGVYIALAIGKLANFQSSTCTWDERNGNIRAAFNRQAIPMTWVFAEGNPFSNITGNFESMLRSEVQSVEKLTAKGSVTFARENAVKVNFPEDSILFTELPYYDNVGYADLSDYFYIWLRRGLRDVFPQLFQNVVTSKDELTSIPEHYGGDGIKAIEAYRIGTRHMLRNFREACSVEYPSVIFFEYTRKDDEAIWSDKNIGGQLTPFEELIDALVQVGFMISAVWPVRTDKRDSRNNAARVAVVFRNRLDDAAETTRRQFVSAMKRELPGMMTDPFLENVDAADKLIVGIGKGLSIFTRYKKVMNADGSDMSVHDAIRLICQDTVEFIDIYEDN